MLEQLRPLDDATRERVERLAPRVEARIRAQYQQAPADEIEERAAYGRMALILSLQRHPDRPDGRHIGAAVLWAREFLHDEARAWGVTKRQVDGPRRDNWRPLSIDSPITGGMRRIEELEQEVD